MNFELTDEARMLQDGLRRYLRDAYTPDARAEAAGNETGFSPAIWTGLAEMGVIGALFTEEQGGFAGGGFDLAVVFEELGRAGAVDPLIDTGILGGGLLAAFGEDVEAVIDGSRHLAFAHQEPDARFDPARVTTTASAEGDGWRLRGRKAVVVNAPAAETILVSARVSGGAADREGIGLFAVAAEDLDLRAYPLVGGGLAAEIALEGVPARRLDSDGAYPQIADAEARATLAICAEALGLMEAIRALTVDYLRTRKQFGQPIGKFQVLQHRMAEVLIEIEQSRSAVVNLAGHLEAEDRDRYVSAAKNLIGNTAKLVVEESIQMHGGIGMTEEYELGHLVKRLTMVDHRFGDALHHLQRFIALTAA